MAAMKTFFSAAIVLSAASIGFAGPVPKAIRAQYATLLKAIKAKDTATFKAAFSSDFVNVGPDKKSQNRDEFFKGIDELFNGSSKIDANLKLKSATKRGNDVDVSVDFKLGIHYKPKGMKRAHEVCVDTWRKVDGKWVMVKTVDSLFDVKEVGAKKGK